jgi:hypothetical protein
LRRGRGIYPIASRRHQGRGGDGGSSHDPSGDGQAIVVAVVLTPILALLGPISGKYDYWTSLGVMIVVMLVALWLVLTS